MGPKWVLFPKYGVNPHKIWLNQASVLNQGEYQKQVGLAWSNYTGNSEEGTHHSSVEIPLHWAYPGGCYKEPFKVNQRPSFHGK